MEAAESFIGVVLADRYELSTVLGQGQGGMVFKARHRQLDRFVAVKLLLPENLSDKTAFMRFEREAHSVGRLNHPNIVTVFDLGNWRNERPFLVMDYIEGEDLETILRRDGRLPVDRCLRICTQVCAALAHAHKRGVIHRDLKPRNIMLVNDDEISDFVKLVDFGIAKESNGPNHVSETLTMDGFVVGTPQYMSPEQCRGEKVDARTDVYALAGVLYKMITGSNAIQGESIGEIMNNQIHQTPLPFEKACRYVQVPVEIQRVVYKGLSKNREERQESISRFRAELNEAFARVAATAFTGPADGAQPAQNNAAENLSAKNMDSLRERAVAGDVIAQYELVLRLEYGQGCRANPEEARRWLLYAAKKGMKEAQWRIGDHLLRGESGYDCDPEQAVAWLDKSAEQGYDSAQFSLAWCYEHGLGIEKDLSQAAIWYQKAAKQGNNQASERLRLCVEQLGKNEVPVAAVSNLLGDENLSDDPDTLYALACKVRNGGKRADDKDKAKELFKRAAMFGHDLAQTDYIILALTDPCGPEEQIQAVRWLEKAVDQNNENAKLLLSACLRSGTGCQPDAKYSQQILDELVAQKNTTAQTLLGASLLVGDGLARNIPRGIGILKQAADAGDPYAQWKLAICYRSGLGVVKDQKNMEMLFQKSAEKGFPQGLDAIWKPAGLQIGEAVQIFKSLCASGNKMAFFWLGVCFEHGLGVARDMNQALSHYEQAQSKGLSDGQKAIERIKSAV